MKAKVVRVAGGSAEISIPLPPGSELEPGEELSLHAPGGGVFLLSRDDKARGHFVGSLETLSISEVFGFVCSAIRSGTLVVQGPEAQRTVDFSEGQVCWASSTDPEERLGPILWRFGLVSLEDLEALEPQVRPGVKLGQLLVEKGHLSPADLYRGMQLQIREIVVGLFALEEGDFAFKEGPGRAFSPVKLPERTRDIVLAGMSRAEEVERLRLKVPRGEQPLRTANATAPKDPHEAALFSRIDGGSNVAEVIRASRLGEYAGLKALSALVKAGRVRIPVRVAAPARPASRTTPGRTIAVGLSPLQTYKAVIRFICDELTEAGASAGRLNTFFTTVPEGLEEIFRGVCLTSNGDLDVETVLANAEEVNEGALGRAVALEALDAFLSFALFDARNVLHAEKADALEREVARALRGK